MPKKSTSLVVQCPTCKASVSWTAEQPHKPFCSDRCKLIDLGDWIDEKNRIPEHVDKDIHLN